MQVRHKRFEDERGMVLFNSLLILSLLVVVGVAARIMVQTDFKILTNLRGSTEAFYVADAGIEWGKSEISKSTNHPPNPAGGTQNFSTGSFAVSFLSPVVISPLSARIVVRSMGEVRNSSHVLQSQIIKTYDLADGAVSLRGNASRVGFAGNSFLLSGIDHNPATAQAVSASKPRPAISVADEVLQSLVEQSLSNSQQTSAVQSGGTTPAVAQSDALPASAMSRLADELCSSAHALTTFVPPDGVLTVESETWGTRSSPQLRCIDGLAGPGDSVNLRGSTNGAGILIARNTELIVSGSFHWEGLIIVTGSNVSFKVMGAESKEIYGALMINETGMPGTETGILDIQGSVRVLFSRSALSQIVSLIPSTLLQPAYASLPFVLAQEYWRTVTP
jgi:Tfp pilus assembly protein PilX